jgi:hypothetical protein
VVLFRAAFLKLTKVIQILIYFSAVQEMRSFLQKTGLGYIFGDLFTNLSGHPYLDTLVLNNLLGQDEFKSLIIIAFTASFIKAKF